MQSPSHAVRGLSLVTPDRLAVSHSSAFYSMETWGSKMVKYSFAVLVLVSAPTCS